MNRVLNVAILGIYYIHSQMEDGKFRLLEVALEWNDPYVVKEYLKCRYAQQVHILPNPFILQWLDRQTRVEEWRENSLWYSVGMKHSRLWT